MHLLKDFHKNYQVWLIDKEIEKNLMDFLNAFVVSRTLADNIEYVVKIDSSSKGIYLEQIEYDYEWIDANTNKPQKLSNSPILFSVLENEIQIKVNEGCLIEYFDCLPGIEVWNHTLDQEYGHKSIGSRIFWLTLNNLEEAKRLLFFLEPYFKWNCK